MKVKYCGFEFEVFGHEWFWPTVGAWEPDTFDILKRFADPTKVFIDCGAWNGVVSLPASRLFKHVHAFEPDPVAFYALQENTIANRPYSIQCENVALGVDNGTCLIFGDEGDSMSSMVNADKSKKAYQVKTIRLSEVIESYGSEIGLLKMDIEGGEVLVLPEIKEALAKHKPALLLSLHPFWFPEVESNSQTIADILFDVYCGYNSATFEPFTKEEFLQGLGAGCHTYLFMKCE